MPKWFAQQIQLDSSNSKSKQFLDLFMTVKGFYLNNEF